MILILAEDNFQERTLGLTLRWGGYETRVVKDTLEAVNLIKSVPLHVRGVVIGGAGCQKALAKRMKIFSASQVRLPVYLVGLASKMSAFNEVFDPALTLFVCRNEELLERVRKSGC